jgi:signal transduction histidine kinase
MGVIASIQPPWSDEMSRAYFEVAKKGTRMRLIGDITGERIDYVKDLMKNVEVRHLDGVGSYFGVSDSEYLAVPGREEFNPAGPLLYSNEEPFVKHHQALFDMLWEKAIPADVRIEEHEKGEKLGETKVTFSTREIFDSANRFVSEMKEEALVLVSREGGIKDNLKFFQGMVSRASRVGARVRILGRFYSEEMELMREFRTAGVQIRTLAPGQITGLALGIYDRKGMGLVQYIYPDSRKSEGQTYLTGVISTNKQTVAGISAIFDSLWDETELRQEAQLMQDILTHDITNYNQISMSNAEVLKDGLRGDEKLVRFVDSIIRAINGSTELIEKTKMLATIVTDKEASLHPVDLEESIDRSLSLVKRAYSDKAIEVSSGDFPEARVIADSLLDQVFVNILSNAVKYTQGTRVPLTIRIEPEEEEVVRNVNSPKRQYWKVEVTDQGRGMPDDMKADVSMRYLGTAKGKGLGLSITRALVVDRYSGRFGLKDRVEGDYHQGTRVEVWLPRA